MAVTYINGFETGDLATVQIANQPGNLVVMSSDTPGNWSDWALQIVGGTSVNYGQVGFPVPNAVSDIYLACRVKFESLENNSHFFLIIYDTLSTAMAALAIGAAGNITAYRGTATSIQVSGKALSFDEWHLFEMRYYAADSGGRIVVDIDGVNFIDYTGDSNASTSATIGQFYWLASSDGTYDTFLDDYVYDDAATPGDVAVIGLHPNADGDTSQWTEAPSITRVYFPSSTVYPSDVVVARDAAWDGGNGDSRRAVLLREPTQSSPMAQVQDNGISSANSDILMGQWISEPIAAQTITGTVKGQFRVQEGTGGGSDSRSQIVIRVVSGDGSTVRGTLLAASTSSLSSEWNSSTVTNRKFPLAADSPATLSSVTAQEGDRIVIEIGARDHASSSTFHTLRVGDSGVADLPEDETSTLDYNPWIEFSNAITTAAAHYVHVDEEFRDDASTYIYDDTVDNLDLFTFEDLASNIGDVKAIVLRMRARTSEPAGSSIALAIKNGGTEDDGDDIVLGGTWRWHERVMAVDPSDDGAWTRTKANSLQAGPKTR